MQLSKWDGNPGTRDPELSKQLVAPGKALPLAVYNNSEECLQEEQQMEVQKEPKRDIFIIINRFITTYCSRIPTVGLYEALSHSL